MNYELQSVSPAAKTRGRITAELVEDGVVIAKVKRAAIRRNYVPSFETRFLSERSRDRFVGYCDSLSVSEVVETFYLNAVALATK